MKIKTIYVLLILLFYLNGTIIESENFSKKLNQGIKTNSGSLVLLEEYTATWCQSCAEIEPGVKELAEIHNERIALVALHPADGVDDLGNYASANRINSLFNGEIKSTPTFIIDRENVIEGVPELSALNSLILQSQSKKSNFSEIEFSVIRINNDLLLNLSINENSSGIINLMILENKVTSNNPAGDLDKFDNVLKELISINITSKELITNDTGSNLIISENNEKLELSVRYKIKGDLNIENIGFISTHEILENGNYKVKGVAKIIQGEIVDTQKSDIMVIFGLFLFLGIFASVGLLNDNNKKDEESE